MYWLLGRNSKESTFPLQGNSETSFDLRGAALQDLFKLIQTQKCCRKL